MATSSITEQFSTNDPKAANTLVRLLFTETPPTPMEETKATFIPWEELKKDKAAICRMKRAIEKRTGVKCK